MKLRVHECGITLRLQPEEIVTLFDKNKLVQRIEISNKSLEIVIEIQEVAEIDIIYSENGFLFIFPSQRLNEWGTTSKVGYIREYKTFSLVIEKDMPRKRKQP
ncbi:MAG: hypothetical protein RLQ12_10110 [Cyclobacteriaceae bacterium]